MAKSPAQLDAEIEAELERVKNVRCNTCTRPLASPFRRSVGGKIVEGCVDDSHTGHIYGESLRWHMRPAAKEIRKASKERLREITRKRR